MHAARIRIALHYFIVCPLALVFDFFFFCPFLCVFFRVYTLCNACLLCTLVRNDSDDFFFAIAIGAWMVSLVYHFLADGGSHRDYGDVIVVQIDS
jgi:hypothetical protein